MGHKGDKRLEKDVYTFQMDKEVINNDNFAKVNVLKKGRRSEMYIKEETCVTFSQAEGNKPVFKQKLKVQ